MSILLPEQRDLVRAPSLRGQYYLGVITYQGYQEAVLARSLAGYKRTFQRLFESEHRLLTGISTYRDTMRIQVVAPGPSLRSQVDEWSEEDIVRTLIREVEHKLYPFSRGGSLRKTPPGWDVVAEKEDPTRDVVLGETVLRWKGVRGIAETFSDALLPKVMEDIFVYGPRSYNPPDMGTWRPSQAEVCDIPEYVLFRGWAGGDGERMTICSCPDRSLVSEVPAFYFNVLEKVPGILHPMIREWENAHKPEFDDEDEQAEEYRRAGEKAAAEELQAAEGWFAPFVNGA